MTGTTIGHGFVRLAARAAADPARLIVATAPVGYDKGRFAREAAAHVGDLRVATLAADPGRTDLYRTVLDALAAGDQRRAGRSAADRLAQSAQSATASSRELLRPEWALSGGPQLFVLRDATGLLATPDGVDLLADLVAALPPGRKLLVTTRAPLPPALLTIVERTESFRIGDEELAVTERAVEELAGAAGLERKIGRTFYALTAGWPLVARLLCALVRLGEPPEELLDAARSLQRADLFAFAVHRCIARLDGAAREALVVAALLREASNAQLVRILGERCDDVVFARLTALPFVVVAAGRLIVHPDVVSMLDDRFPHLVKPLYDRALSALTGDAAYIDAANVALRRGDVGKAAAIIDAAPSYLMAPAPLHEYERIIERLDRQTLTRYPNLWIATMPYRSFAVDRATFVREAETVYYCLPAASAPDQRARALMLLSSALMNMGRRAEAERLIAEALDTFARSDDESRASLLSFLAWMSGNDGRFARAHELAAEAATIVRRDFSDNQTLHYIEMHEAAYRGQNERVRVIVDELLRRDETPLHRAFTAGNGALFTWANGDDAGFLGYLAEMEETLTPGLERGFRPVIDAARGRPGAADEDYAWPVMHAVAQLFRMGNATSNDEALDAARRAARAADERDDPYTQTLAYSALHVLGPELRKTTSEKLRATVRRVESNELQAAVLGLLEDRDAGMLEEFVRRRVQRLHVTVAQRPLVVELLAGRVVRDGVEIKLSYKEFELLALLGSAPSALSRDRIGEALWDHLAPEEWPNNLKVTLSRLRRKLAMHDAVTILDGSYRLSPLIDVDLRRAEALLRRSVANPADAASRAQLAEIVEVFTAGGIARYERFAWAYGLRARIESIVCEAATLLAKAAVEQRNWNEAMRFADVVAAVDSYDDAACEVRIRVLVANGDADAARREYRRYAASLAHELGAKPSGRLAELVR
ncbi:MAG TPA: winged helix-turn-helix domain-containing protein [Candidatus Elarobacter sp.]